MKLHLSLILIVLTLLPQTVYAFTCRQPSFEENFRRAHSIFVGEIIDGIGGTKCGSKQMTFKVLETFKGNPDKEVEIYSTDACSQGGMYLTKGETYLLFTRYNSKVEGRSPFSVGACSGTTHISRAPLDELKFKVSQINALDEALSKASSDNIYPILRIKAEILLEREDYEALALVLQEILKNAPEDYWAIKNLMEVYQSLDKPEAIWELYQNKLAVFNAPSHARDRKKDHYPYVSYAAVSLGIPYEKWKQLTLRGVSLENSIRENQKFYSVSMEDVRIDNSSFANSDFSSGRITEARMHNLDFSGSTFLGSSFNDVTFSSSNLAGANFNRATFLNTRFSQANAANANFAATIFEGGYIQNVQFNEADFSSAKLQNITLNDVDFSNAVFSDTEFVSSKYNCGTKWPEGFDPDPIALVLEDRSCERREAQQEELEKEVKMTTGDGKDYSYQELDKEDLRGLDLTNTTFQEAKIKNTQFDYSTLDNVNFNWAGISAGQFNNTLITNVDWSYASLTQPSFTSASITKTSFKNSVIHASRFTNSQIKDTDFSGSKIKGGWIEGTSFENVDFKDTYVLNINISGSTFTNNDFTNAKLNGLNFNNTRRGESAPSVFKNSDFKNASIEEANLAGVDFTGSNLSKASLLLSKYDCSTIWPKNFNPSKKGAVLPSDACETTNYTPPVLPQDLSGRDLTNLNLRNADLSNHILKGAKLSGSNLSGADLKKADLTAVEFNCDTIWPENFDPIKAGAYLEPRIGDDCIEDFGSANLSGKDLSGLNLFYAPFASADLTKANLKNASLGRADLFKANLTNADLSGAELSSANLRQAIVQGAKYDCNTLWPEYFNPEENGAVLTEKECVQSNKQVMAGVRALLSDWRKPKISPEEKTIISDEELPWFSSQAREISNIEFKNSMMRKAYLDGKTFYEVSFINVNLRDSKFKNSKMINVDFRGSDLTKADFYNTRMENVSFEGANISGVNFDRSEFKNVNWSDAIFDCETKGTPLTKNECLRGAP